MSICSIRHNSRGKMSFPLPVSFNFCEPDPVPMIYVRYTESSNVWVINRHDTGNLNTGGVVYKKFNKNKN